MNKTEKLRGEFGRDSLPGLIQYLAHLGVSGELTLRTPGSTTPLGAVSLDRGKVVDARMGPRSGQEALFHALNLERGQFSFVEGPSAFDSTIEVSLESLLLGAAYWQDTHPELPPVTPESVPRLKLDEIQGNIRFTPPELMLTTRINGQRSVSLLAQSYRLELEVALGAVGTLMGKGIVDLVPELRPRVDPAFWTQLEPLLTRLSGPMARFKLQDALEKVGLIEREQLETAQVSAFLDALEGTLTPAKRPVFQEQVQALRERHAGH